MTSQGDFKRRVRARMAKTGESYTTARRHLLADRAFEPTAWMTEALHVSNGDATDLIGTGLARRVEYWRDVLHEGPVPAVADDELDRVFSENHRTIEGSWTTAGLMRSMRALFDQFGGYSNSMLDFANATTDFVDNVYREFHEKHGFPKLDPPQLNLQKHVVRMGQLKQATEHFCSDPVNVAFPKFLVIRNFYEQVVTEARGVFRQVRADFESWLGNSLVPLSTQLKEHQKLLERRVENIRKVSGDLSSIKERCEVLEVQRRDLQGQVTELAKIRAVLRGIPETDMGLRNPHAA